MIVTQQPPAAPLSSSVTVALTAGEKAALAAAAKRAGVSMSAYGRQAVVARLRQTSSPS